MSQQVWQQCELHRSVGDCLDIIVAFIPERFARVGQCVQITDTDSESRARWVVHKAWTKVSESDMPNSRQQIRKHRTATGDATRSKRRRRSA